MHSLGSILSLRRRILIVDEDTELTIQIMHSMQQCCLARQRTGGLSRVYSVDLGLYVTNGELCSFVRLTRFFSVEKIGRDFTKTCFRTVAARKNNSSVLTSRTERDTVWPNSFTSLQSKCTPPLR